MVGSQSAAEPVVEAGVVPAADGDEVVRTERVDLEIGLVAGPQSERAGLVAGNVIDAAVVLLAPDARGVVLVHEVVRFGVLPVEGLDLTDHARVILEATVGRPVDGVAFDLTDHNFPPALGVARGSVDADRSVGEVELEVDGLVGVVGHVDVQVGAVVHAADGRQRLSILVLQWSHILTLRGNEQKHLSLSCSARLS